jgi:uncharacterized integral membrane protein
MPWRLIGFIFIFAVFLVFIAFNLGNNCDISFGFRVFRGVPVYLTAFSAFVLGMLAAIPFMLSFGFKKGREQKRKALGRKKRDPKEEAAELFPDIPPDLKAKGGPYGID